MSVILIDADGSNFNVLRLIFGGAENERPRLFRHGLLVLGGHHTLRTD